nr:MAG TPA: hypothetical protein [Crassvirales sp.]
MITFSSFLSSERRCPANCLLDFCVPSIVFPLAALIIAKHSLMLESQYSFHHNFKICQGCILFKKEVISSLLTDKALALSIPTVVGIFLFFVVAVAVAIAIAVGGFAALLFFNS